MIKTQDLYHLNTLGFSNHASLHDKTLPCFQTEERPPAYPTKLGTGVIPAEGAIWILLNHNESRTACARNTVTLGAKAQHKVIHNYSAIKNQQAKTLRLKQ